MVRASGKSSVVALLSAAISLVAVGCADEAGDGALRIIRNQYIEEESCVVGGAGATASRSSGAIEVSSPRDYQLTPIVQNYATSSSGKFTSQRTAFLEGARVDLTFADPNLFTAAEVTQMETDGVTKFTSQFSATVTPDNGTSGMVFAVVPVELLRKISTKLTADKPSTVVSVKVRVFGQMGGGEVESESFVFPVSVCDTNKAPGSCVIASVAATCGGTAEPRIGNPCNPFQDGPVDCCVSGGTLFCPSPVSTVTASASADN